MFYAYYSIGIAQALCANRVSKKPGRHALFGHESAEDSKLVCGVLPAGWRRSGLAALFALRAEIENNDGLDGPGMLGQDVNGLLSIPNLQKESEPRMARSLEVLLEVGTQSVRSPRLETLPSPDTLWLTLGVP